MKFNAAAVSALRSNVLRGFKGETSIVGYSFVAANSIRIISTIILSRILAPEAFGAIGLVVSVQVALVMLTDVGFQPFIVRHERGQSPEFLDTVWTIRLVRSVLLAAALLLLSSPIAHLLDKPELTDLFRAFSLIFVIDALASVAPIVSLRNRKLAPVVISEISGGVIQLIATIPLALALKSYWAIVIAMIISSSGRVILSYTIFPNSRVRLRLDKDVLKEVLAFGRFIAPSSAITLLLSQTDRLILSRVFSLDVFGLYVIAFNLASMPLGLASSYASKVLYPRYAEAWRKSPEALSNIYYSTKRWVALLYSTMSGCLVGFSPLIVEILYDDRYLGASSFLSILAIGSLFLLNNLAAREALVASGKVQITLVANIVRLSWLIAIAPTCFYLFGAYGLISAFVSVEAAALVYQWINLRRAGILSVREELLTIGVGVLAALASSWLSSVIHPYLVQLR